MAFPSLEVFPLLVTALVAAVGVGVAAELLAVEKAVETCRDRRCLAGGEKALRFDCVVLVVGEARVETRRLMVRQILENPVEMRRN